MTDRLGEALADLEGRDYLVPHDIEHAYGSWLDVVAAARAWHALTNQAQELDYEAARAVAIRRLGTPRMITVNEIIAAALHIEPGQQARVVVLEGSGDV